MRRSDEGCHEMFFEIGHDAETSLWERAMANPFVHVELATNDIDKAKSFYRSLFDWKLSDMDMGGGMSYTMIDVGDGTGGGMMKHPMPGAPSAWLAYVNVDDIKAATATAASLGATVFREVTEVPNAGSFSIITDPTGAMLGLWQPLQK
jgi:predicted enzyme related to lactoylglutathione lyase